MKQNSFSTKVLAEIAIFAALGLVLDALSSGIFRGVWANGGSICIAMVAVFIISYRRGLISGLLCGFVLSIVQMIPGIYVINGATYSGAMRVLAPFIQILLDYVLGYTLCGLAGAFSKKFKETDSKTTKINMILIGTILGGLLKFVCHVLAGGLFWLGDGSGSFWGVANSSWLYSFVYNGTYCIPNIILCTAIMLLIALKYEFFLNPKEPKKEAVAEHRTIKNIIIKSVMILVAGFVFVFSTIKVVKSAYSYENDDMVHTKLLVNDSVISDNFTGNSYEIKLNAGDKLTIDLSDKADGYTCVKKIQVKGTDTVILFGWEGNYTEASSLTLTPDAYEDWGEDYTAIYAAITYEAATEQTIVLTSYLGGSGLDLDMDFVIALIASAIVLVYAIFGLIKESRDSNFLTFVIFGVANVVISAYCLGTFFKALNKANLKHKPFDFNANGKYLFVGIILIVLYCIIALTYYLITKNKKNNQVENKDENYHSLYDETKEDNKEIEA